MQDSFKIKDKFFKKYSHRIECVPTLTDLIIEKMKPDEDFVQFVDRWRLLSSKMRILIHESEQIKLIINNVDPYLKTWMSLTGIPVSFIELYSKGRTIQNQLTDPYVAVLRTWMWTPQSCY